MKTLTPILILLCAAATWADTAEFDATYFHPAASLYIHGDAAAASNLVARGLSINPDDGKLQRLEELLKQQQQDQQDQQQQDDQQNQDQEQNQEQQNDQQQNDQDNQQDPEQQQDQQDQEQQQPAEPQQAEQMTPEEAQQLLDAMKQEEENKRLQLHPVMGAPVKVDKDW